MAKKNLVSIIDLGTYKCTTIIGILDNEDSFPRVIGMGIAPTLGVKKSNIVDLEQARESIVKSVEQAEAMAGVNITEAIVLISGTNVSSLNSSGMVSITSQNQEIEENDIERVRYNTKSVKIPSGKTLIHLVDQTFKVDDQDGIENPIGMTGMRLELKAHLILASETKLHHLETCLKDSNIKVTSFVFSALGASSIALTETEKELGSLLIDIGAGTTNFCMFCDNSLEYSGSIPIGARNFTTDLTQFYNMNIEDAEKIKIFVSSESKIKKVSEPNEEKNRRRKGEKFDLSNLDLIDSNYDIYEEYLLQKIFYPRFEEIFNEIFKQLKKAGLTEKISGGVVLTGGGSKTRGSIYVAKKIFKTSARLGNIKDDILLNVEKFLRDPQYASILGGLTYYLKNNEETEMNDNIGNGFSIVWDKVKNFFKNIIG